MTDHTALWAIFILLCVLFVVHIVVARRGPWQPPASDRPIIVRAPGEDIERVRLIVGVDPAGGPDEDHIVVMQTWKPWQL